jgi:hypothetical protein
MMPTTLIYGSAAWCGVSDVLIYSNVPHEVISIGQVLERRVASHRYRDNRH